MSQRKATPVQTSLRVVGDLIQTSLPTQPVVFIALIMGCVLGLMGQGQDILWSLAAEVETWMVLSTLLLLLGLPMLLAIYAVAAHRVWDCGDIPHVARHERFWQYAAALSPVWALLLAYLLAGFRAWRTAAALAGDVSAEAGNDVYRGFFAGALAVLCVGVVAWLGVRQVSRGMVEHLLVEGVRMQRWKRWLRPLTRFTGLQGDHEASDYIVGLGLFTAGLLVVLVLVMGTWWAHLATPMMPIGIILFAFAAWVPLLMVAHLWCHQHRLPFVVILASLFLISSCHNDNHRVRTLVTTPTQASPPVKTPVDEAFDRWLRTNLAGEDDLTQYTLENPYPVLLVAAAGGGIRNAYWTAGTLGMLEDRLPGVGRLVFVIWGVSGGAVGAATHVSLKADFPATPGPEFYSNAGRDVLRSDLLSPLLLRALGPDLAQRFVPTPIHLVDRARALEDALSQSYLNTVDQSARTTDPDFGLQRDLYTLHQTRTPGVPYLVFNTTCVQSGDVRPVTELEFETIDSLSPPGGLTLATASLLSARFPLVTPAALIQHNGRDERLVDGGYFDNAGIETLTEIIEELVETTTAFPVPVKLYVLTIEYDQPVPDRRPGMAGEIRSPLETMMALRESRSRLAEQRLAERLALSSVNQGRVTTHPHVLQADLVPPYHARVPLGWVLSDQAQTAIDQQLAAYAACIQTHLLRNPEGSAEQRGWNALVFTFRPDPQNNTYWDPRTMPNQPLPPDAPWPQRTRQEDRRAVTTR